ncbi:MAG TPA: DUF5937 family protein [Pseudonocardia sp.]|nr:DUF5937 family protein [Pseudonocardia sp.]
MAVTLLLGESAPELVTVRVSALAELCACLHALDCPEHHPRSAAWTAGATEELGAGTLAEARRFAALCGPFRARYLLPLNGTDRDLDDELRRIGELPVAEFTAMTGQALLGENEAPGPTGDPASARAFLTHLRRISPDRLELGEQLLADPAAVRAALLSLLASVHRGAFAAEWRRVAPALLAGAREMGRLLHLRGPAALATLPATTELFDPWRVEFDKLYRATVRLGPRRCLLVPTLHGDPHLVIKHYPGHPVVIQYPVAPDAAEVPPLELLRRRLAALNDPTRIELCRSILRTPVPTVELARQLRMTAPQVSRHLRQLREAGLVRTTRHGSTVHYQLDTAAVAELGADLLSNLRR